MKTRMGAAVMIGAVLGAMLAACGAEGADPMAGCTDDASSAGAPGDADPLLVLGSADYAPTIVYADGAVVVPESAGADSATAFLHLPMMAPGFHGEQPGSFQGGGLSDCELGAVVDAADALFTPDVDFGEPLVTDQSSTEVTYRDRTASVYAFSRADPTEWGDLSGAQERAREQLAELWDMVEGAAEADATLPVDRLFIHGFGSVDDAEVTDWPLPVPVSELAAQPCTTLTDQDDVARMIDRLDDGPLLESEDWRIAVVAAAPGVPDCGA